MSKMKKSLWGIRNFIGNGKLECRFFWFSKDNN